MLTPGDVQIGTEWEADEEITIDRTTDRFCRQVGPGVCRTDRRLMDLDATDQTGSLAYSMVVPVDPESGGTRASEHVAVDLGAAKNLLMKLTYQFMRGPRRRG